MADMVDIYRRNGIILQKDSQQQNVDNYEMINDEGFDFKKSQVNSLDYTRSVIPKFTGSYFDNIELKTDKDGVFINLLQVVLGEAKLDEELLRRNKSIITEVYARNTRDVAEKRFEALIAYYQGDLEKSYLMMKDGLALLQAKDNIPNWIIADISIDMRNLQIQIDRNNGVLSLGGEGQQILDEEDFCIYNPIVDRRYYQLYETISRKENEQLIESPFTVHFIGDELSYNNIKDAFISVVYCLSITHINLARKNILAVIIPHRIKNRNHN